MSSMGLGVIARERSGNVKSQRETVFDKAQPVDWGVARTMLYSATRTPSECRVCLQPFIAANDTETIGQMELLATERAADNQTWQPIVAFCNEVQAALKALDETERAVYAQGACRRSNPIVRLKDFRISQKHKRAL